MKLSQMLRKVALLGLCSVTFSAVADAQPPRGDGGKGQPPQEGGRGDRQGRGGGRGGFGGGGFGMMGGGMMGGMMAPRIDRATLLGNDKVRTELKIEEAQAATIDAALDAYREERNSAPRPDRDAFQNMSEEERTKFFTDMQKQREELSKKTDTVLNALLEEGQIKRLDQIAVQARLQMGALQALMADDMKTALTITEEQVGKLKEVETKAQEDMQKMMEEMRANFQPGQGGGPGGGFEGMREKMETARKAVTDSAMAVLTDAQKSKLEEMKGAAFEIDARSLMGGRGGFGGGGPGGPGGGGPGGQGGRGGRGQGGGRGGRPAE